MMYWDSSQAVLGDGEGQADSGHSVGAMNRPSDREVERIRQARHLRVKFFDAKLFADPAWDMLLDLYRAHLAQQRICTTSLCIGSGAPVSTALRWLNALEQRGLAQRSQDPLDGRRFWVSLTDEGVAAMAGYFGAAQSL